MGSVRCRTQFRHLIIEESGEAIPDDVDLRRLAEPIGAQCAQDSLQSSSARDRKRNMRGHHDRDAEVCPIYAPRMDV